jgi:hypothetical protein
MEEHPEPTAFEVQIATVKLNRCKSAGSEQILAELVQAGDDTLCSESIMKTCLGRRQGLLLYSVTRKSIKLAAVIFGACYQLHIEFYQISFLVSCPNIHGG